MPTVLTVGTFDLFHSGHVKLLKECRKYADVGYVYVGVNSDRFVATFKKPAIHSLRERITVVESCRYVDIVFENDDSCLESLLLTVKPRYLIVGSDWAPPKDYMAQIGTTEEWLLSHNIELVYVPRSDESQSSTKIRQEVIANG